MDGDKKAWKRRELFNLIARFEQYPELYNTKHTDYRNQERKKFVLNTLANEFGTGEHDIVKKLHNLRSQFSQHLKKMNTNKEEGNPEKGTGWPYFGALVFLEPYITTRERPKILNFSQFLSESNSDNSYDIKSESADQSDSEASESPMPTPAKRHKTPESYSQPNEIKMTNPLRIVDQNDDEYKTFGEFIANELKNIHFDKNKRELKRLIQKNIIKISEVDDNEFFGS